MVNKIPQVLVCTDVHLKLKHPLSMTWMLLQVLNIYIYQDIKWTSSSSVDDVMLEVILCASVQIFIIFMKKFLDILFREHFALPKKSSEFTSTSFTFYLHTRNKLFFVYSILGIHSRCLLFAFHCSPQVLIRLWNFATSALQIRFISFLGFCWEGLHLI